MSDATPLTKLLSSWLPADRLDAAQTEAVKVQELPRIRILSELQSPDMKNDPKELIQHRFLYRGGVCLLVGPTGVGKSAFLMQLALHLSVGKPLFGIKPGEHYRQRGMRILLIQAENDDGDLAEMRDGVLKGCELSDPDKLQAQQRVAVCTLSDRSGDRFAATLEALLAEHGPFDILIIDPAFAYLGGDSNSQRDVSHFMRELMNPLLQKHQIGLILAHHTNKPLRGKEKEGWEAGDFAYLGAGSAEWINPARAALAIRSIGSETIFELRAPKRGRRLGWEEDDGQSTTVQHIAHFREPGIICWRQAQQVEVDELLEETGRNRTKKVSMVELLHCIAKDENQNQSHYKKEMSRLFNCAPNSVQNALAEGVKQGLLRFHERGQQKLYHVTEKARQEVLNQPSTAGCTDQ
ncbi:MAG: AAA family ATPase [Verrucomicrobiales bacterium]|nr:AAA family ATPase [Verrucomicrobiales bacterium]